MGKACFDESKMRNFLLLTLGHKYHCLSGMKEKYLTYLLYVMDVSQFVGLKHLWDNMLLEIQCIYNKYIWITMLK